MMKKMKWSWTLAALLVSGLVGGTANARQPTETIDITQCAFGDWNAGAGHCDCHAGASNTNGGLSCEPNQGNPLPGTPPTNPPPGGGGGGSGGGPPPTNPPTCDAACKERKKQHCISDSNMRATACNDNNRAFLNYCMNQWAPNTAVDKCTAGGRNLGLGVDGVSRRAIQILQDCDVVDMGTDERGHPRPSLVVCHPRLDTLGRQDWWDPQTQTSAWDAGGCLSGWCDGAQGGTVTQGGSSTQNSATWDVSLTPWGGFVSAGGHSPSRSNSTDAHSEFHVDPHQGMYEQCSDAHTMEVRACEVQRQKDVTECAK